MSATRDPQRNVPRAMLASGLLAGLFFGLLPMVWLGTLGSEPLGKDLALALGPTYAPWFGNAGKSVAIWFMVLSMFAGTMQPLAGASRRAPRGILQLGLAAAVVWGLSALLGFEQSGLTTVLIGLAFAYSGSALYAWRKFTDRREAGLPGMAGTLQIKLTGAMLVLVLDGTGYLLAVSHLPEQQSVLMTVLSDIFCRCGDAVDHRGTGAAGHDCVLGQ